MIRVAALLALCASLARAAEPLTSGDPTALFSAWKAEHGVAYASAAEDAARLDTFRANLRRIDALNGAGGAPRLGGPEDAATYAPNRFADLSPEEFRERFLMRGTTAPARNPPVEVLSRGGRGGVDLRAALPSSLDWRTHSPPVVGAVHNQGSVGTCYAFSALEALASQWALKTGNLTALSVQAIVDCGYVSAPPYATCGVFGGYPWLVYDYIKSRGGIMSAADVPYCSGGGPDVCYPCVPPSYNTTLCGPGPTYCNKTQTPSCDTLFDPSRFVAKVSGYVSIKNDTTAHKEALAGQPLSVCLNASMLQFYHHGVWNPHLACNRGYNTIDHCVMLVGWDDENDSYLVRNSWGEKWGLQGYFHIKQGNTCGIQEMTTYPTV